MHVPQAAAVWSWSAPADGLRVFLTGSLFLLSLWSSLTVRRSGGGICVIDNHTEEARGNREEASIVRREERI
ncbi:hypothetical protein RIF29_34469 [Crotalaria pallida]|uniref:Uncharacterized protein n=1 Tax=Crotalaria pallida TaxID=3830 RepID=A0AAN9EEV5_CROPI